MTFIDKIYKYINYIVAVLFFFIIILTVFAYTFSFINNIVHGRFFIIEITRFIIVFFFFFFICYNYLKKKFNIIPNIKKFNIILNFCSDLINITQKSNLIYKQIYEDNISIKVRFYEKYISPIMNFIFIIYMFLLVVQFTFDVFFINNYFAIFAWFICSLSYFLKIWFQNKYIKPHVDEYFNKNEFIFKEFSSLESCRIRNWFKIVFIKNIKKTTIRCILYCCSVVFSIFCGVNYLLLEVHPDRKTLYYLLVDNITFFFNSTPIVPNIPIVPNTPPVIFSTLIVPTSAIVIPSTSIIFDHGVAFPSERIQSKIELDVVTLVVDNISLKMDYAILQQEVSTLKENNVLLEEQIAILKNTTALPRKPVLKYKEYSDALEFICECKYNYALEFTCECDVKVRDCDIHIIKDSSDLILYDKKI